MKTLLTPALWNPVKWPSNDAEPYASWQCFARKFGAGRVILYPSQFTAGEWSYVASFGANDDRSHSGGFPDGFTLDQAKDKIEAMFQAGKFRKSL